MTENGIPAPKPNRPESRVRDHLANVRTYLAWIRTALGLIGVGFVLARMGVFLRQLTALGDKGPHREFRGSHEFLISGVAFLLLGMALCVGSAWLYQRTRVAIDESRYEPPRYAVTGLTILVVAGSLAITGLVLWQLVDPGQP